jgi:GTPase
MLIDDVKIKIQAGHGGRGKVAFNKNMNSLGPAGGSGGNGGSIYMEGVSNLDALKQFRYKKELTANDGQNGKEQFRDGNNGADLIIKVPVGTVIHNLTTKQDAEIVHIGERVHLAKGGHGGKGNYLFRSSRNTSPTQFQEGLQGEGFDLRLELKLIADVGLIGLPNVGKSSLINELTNANSRVANYHFTTLEPSLGVYGELVLADIPGLIEGAASGKGLGIKFLRHVERTRTMFHLISSESNTPVKDYRTIRKELKAHNPELLKKKEYIFLSKSDEVDEQAQKKKVNALKKLKLKVEVLSILDDKSLSRVQQILKDLIKEKIK